MHILIYINRPIAYPYSLPQLRRDNSGINFPPSPTVNLLDRTTKKPDYNDEMQRLKSRHPSKLMIHECRYRRRSTFAAVAFE